MATYLCVKCNNQVDKPALKSVKDWSGSNSGASSSGLGTWNCKRCGGKTKVIAHYKRGKSDETVS